MERHPRAENEAERLRLLAQSGLLDAPRSAALDRITEEARAHFGAAVCALTLVDAERCLLRSEQGSDLAATPRDQLVCSWTILSDAVLVVPDLAADDRFAANPLVTGPPHLRFYAGAPLVYAPGLRLGALCLLDTRPRRFSLGDRAELQVFADRARSVLIEQALDGV